jgi:hypothetical protein
MGETQVDIIEAWFYRAVGTLRRMDKDADAIAILVRGIAALTGAPDFVEHRGGDVVAVNIDPQNVYGARDVGATR